MRSVARNLFILAAILSIFVLSTAETLAAPANGLDWQNSTITVTGTGATPPNTVNMVQGRMMARRTAVVDGYRQLAEIIKGVHVNSETTVENFMMTSDVTKTSVDALIQGAQIISEREIPGGYEVTMSVPMFGVSNSLASAVMPKQEKRENFPAPVKSVTPSMPAYDTSTSVSVRIDVTSKKTPVPAKSNNAIGGYTGLIVDCRGLGIRPVMSPVIKNANSEPIYGHKNLDSHYVIANGMASYTTDIENGTKRAGSNPLVVKAIALENHNGNPVISVADANRVLIENQSAGFLEKTNVVFVR